MKSRPTIMKYIKVGAIALGVVGCSKTITRTDYIEVPVEREVIREVPGAVEYIWEEPMVDVVEVPPGLDPDGHYYRPAHQEVVEIRQGRWRYYKDRGQ